MNRSANTTGSTLRAASNAGPELGRCFHLRDADARALRGRLDDHRQPDGGERPREIGRALKHRILRGGHARAHHDALGLELVHGERTGEHPAPRVRDSQPLESPLHHAILAPRPMQRDPRAIESLAHQILNGTFARIERVRIHAAPLERRQHRIAAQQRYLPLGRVAAQEHGDLAEILRILRAARLRPGFEQRHAGSPTMRTSVASSIPWTAATVRLTCRISASISAARAAP